MSTHMEKKMEWKKAYRTDIRTKHKDKILKRKNAKSWLIPNCRHIPACDHPAWFCSCEHSWLTVCAHTVSTHYSFTYICRDTRRSTSGISEALVKVVPSPGWTIFLRMAADVVCVLRLREDRAMRERWSLTTYLRGSRSCGGGSFRNVHMALRGSAHARLAHSALKNQSPGLLLRWRANALNSHICL